jgi:hypothetical protein
MKHRPVLALAALLLPAACGGDAGTGRLEDPGRWRPAESGAPRLAALEECDDSTGQIMRLRGYPARPSPETPQYRYRAQWFAKCMRDKGYEDGGYEDGGYEDGSYGDGGGPD